MNKLGNASASWDEYYQNSITRAPYTDAVVFAIKILAHKPDAVIYEFGCGNAQNLGFLRGLFPDAHLRGSDVSNAAIERARTLYRQLDLYVNSQDLGLEPQSLDGIFERASLQHIPKDLGRSYVHQLYEALKPGGQAFFEIANSDHGYASLGDGDQDPVFGYRVFYTLDELRTLFQDFEIDLIFERKRSCVQATQTQTQRPVYDEACFQVYLKKSAG